MSQPATPEEAAEWYCLCAQPKHEHIAAAGLRKTAAVEVFCPQLRFERPRSGGRGKTWVTEALFPGYFFARFHLATRGREIQYGRGVRGIVRFGDRTPAVDPALIERLRETMGEEELAVIEDTPRVGEEIVIAEGVFGGLRALVTMYLPARERVRVLVEFLGREMEVDVPRGKVAVATFAHPLR